MASPIKKRIRLLDSDDKDDGDNDGDNNGDKDGDNDGDNDGKNDGNDDVDESDGKNDGKDDGKSDVNKENEPPRKPRQYGCPCGAFFTERKNALRHARRRKYTSCSTQLIAKHEVVEFHSKLKCEFFPAIT